MVIQRACEDLVLEYCELVDAGRAAALPALFTDDATFEAPPQQPWDREEIERRFSNREGLTERISRHVVTNLRIEVLSDRSASGHCYWTLYRYDGDGSEGPVRSTAPTAVGDYRDRFRRTADGWRIEHRLGTTSFFNPDAANG